MSRAWLFVPGDRPERFDKALASGADRVILDLEDAVAPPGKPAARAALSAWLAATPARVALRLNAADTADFEALAAQPEQTLRAAGLAAARALAGLRGVALLAFGHIDCQADLGLRGALEDELLPWRCELVLASRLARIAPPLDGVTTAFDDPAVLQTDVQRAVRLGFGGKLCIHPRQVAPVRAGFAPTAEQRAWARRVLEAAAAAGGAAVALDGRMVDKPVVLRAEAILREAG